MSSPSSSNIQLVHIYDKTGKIVETIAFQGKYESTPKGATKSTKQMIHLDDSIRIIKNKILKELNQPESSTGILDSLVFKSTSESVAPMINKVSYKELYLFTKVEKKIDPYEAIKSLKDIEMDDKKTKQILDALNIDYSEYNIPPDTVYHYEDLKTFVSTQRTKGPASVAIPLGQKFEKAQDILFNANPFELTENPPEITKQNGLFSFENSLLMNFVTSREPIHVCLAKDVFEFFESKTPDVAIDTEKIAQIYFPFLYKDEIRNSSELLQKQQVLLEETNELLTENIWNLYDTVDLFYDVYSQRKSEQPYIENGMKSFVMNIQTDFVNILHLDTIFKNIHATKAIPFIKYNPGFRRENLYRLYSERTATNGKKIPYLGYNEILKLSKETGKTGQITMYMEADIEEGNQIQLYINFNKDGKISIKTVAKVATAPSVIPTIIQKFVIPEFEKLNDLLYDTGYRMDLTQFENPIVEQIEYIMRIKIQKKMDLERYRGCLSSIFDIESLADNEAKLRFKRVENYEEMDRVALMIHSEYNRTHEIEDVIQVLMNDPVLRMSEEQARDRAIQFFSEHTMIRGELLENAGFLVAMKLDTAANILTVNIDQIQPLEYVSILQTYMDSIIRIFQASESSSPIVDLQSACTSAIDYKEVDKTNIENIVAPEPEMVKQIIQPIVFTEVDDDFFGTSPEIEAKMEDIGEDIDGFEFMDYDDMSSHPPSVGVTTYTSDASEPKGSSASFQSLEEPEVEEPIAVVESPIEETSPTGEPLETPEESSPTGEPLETPEEESPTGEPLETPEEESAEEPTGPPLEEAEDASDEPKKEEQPKKEPEKKPTKKTSEDDDSFFGMDVEGGDGELEQKIEGRPLKNPNPFQEKIEKYDPALILKQEQGKYSPYSRVCPPAVMRQPVLLTEEEKSNIDENHPGSYSTAIKYGSDPNKQNWYICPRYWSFKTNSSVSEEEVAEILKTNPNAIIPPKSRTIPKGSFIYEFNVPKEHLDEKGNYITHYPGFIRGKHPEGFNLPCCFKRMQDIEVVKEKVDKTSNYVIASNSYPIPKLRLGFLPPQIETFLKIDHRQCVEKQNQAIIKKNTDCLLRYGIEQQQNQSFLGIFADIYASSHELSETPSIKEFRDILKRSIDLDMFIKYHNGSLVSIFKQSISDKSSSNKIDLNKYSNSWFAKELSKSKNPDEKVLLMETIASYENFLEYLGDESAYIDHTYMWDIITQPNPKLIPDGLNMVILEIPKTNTVEILCPTSSYSPKVFDPAKETLLILKQDEFYEPIYLYRNQSPPQFVRTFSMDRPEERMKDVLKFIQNTIKYNCKPHSSLPGVYDFQRPYSAKKLAQVLRSDIKPPYYVHHQVMNFQAKIVGLIVSPEKDAPESNQIYVPCSPSPLLDDYGFIFLNDVTVWKDYSTTRKMLSYLKTASGGLIKCVPKYKIIEENMIIGVLTETNQYIRISPSTKNIQDDLQEIEATDYIEADKVIIGKTEPDQKRMKIIQAVRMESKLYHTFRNVVREILSQYEARLYKIQIVDMLENLVYSYSQKIGKLVEILKTAVGDTISFEDDIADEVVLESLAAYRKCTKEDTCQLKMPLNNHVMDIENDRLYFTRLADELLRFHRIRNFVLEPMYFLNLINVDYKINPDEVILLESVLKSENSEDLRVFNFSNYIKNITYENAEPSITNQKYSDQVQM